MKLWSRRKLLCAAGNGIGGATLLNAFGSSLWAAEAVQTCTLTPELTVGPYYYPYELVRQNIREDRKGVPLRFALEVRNAKTCEPVPQAAVDIWHCDALGLYSAFTKAVLGPPPDGFQGPPPSDPDHRSPVDRGPNGPPPGRPEQPGGPPQMKPTDQETFLRGVQITDASGRVAFETIYPGWYQGRDTHIHLQVHMSGHSVANGAHAHDSKRTVLPRYSGGHVCHTGQIAFDDDLSDRIAKLEPYRQHDLRRTLLKEDGVFEGDARDYMMKTTSRDRANLQAGLDGSITVFVDPGATPASVGMEPPRR